MKSSTDSAWRFYGEADPYYGIITDDDHRAGRMTAERRAEFFASGRRHVERVVSAVRAHVDPAFAPQRTMDFGCGVGRLALPLAAVSREVVGVDVSDHMLAEAARNCAEAGVANVRFARSDDQLAAVDGRFDFVHSSIVFQHIPPRRGERLFRRLVERLEPGGIGALHVTVARSSSPARRAMGWARKHVPLVNGLVNVLLLHLPWRYPLMEMNEYDLGRLYLILVEHDCHHVVAQPSRDTMGSTTTTGVMLLFRKYPLPSW